MQTLKNITDKGETHHAESFKILVFIEPLAAAYEILEQIQIKPKDKVAILGDGKLGLSISVIFSNLNIRILFKVSVLSETHSSHSYFIHIMFFTHLQFL